MDVFHAQARGFCVATHGCLVVAIWGREAEVGDLQHILEAQRRAIATYRHCAAVTIIRARPTLGVSPEIRAVAAKNQREIAELNRGTAMVVEAGGARALFFRSIITSVNLLARMTTPQKVFTTIEEAVGWVLTRPGIDPETAAASERIIAAVKVLADRYGPVNVGPTAL
jgi:hypothetical protein